MIVVVLGDINTLDPNCGCSSMVEPQLPKLMAWVRFPSPAPLALINGMFVKSLIRVAFALLLLAVLVLWSAPQWLDSQWMHHHLMRTLSDPPHYQVTIEHIDGWQLLPRSQLTLDGVVLHLPDGATPLRAAQVKLDTPLKPFFLNKILKISRLELFDLEIFPPPPDSEQAAHLMVPHTVLNWQPPNYQQGTLQGTVILQRPAADWTATAAISGDMLYQPAQHTLRIDPLHLDAATVAAQGVVLWNRAAADETPTLRVQLQSPEFYQGQFTATALLHHRLDQPAALEFYATATEVALVPLFEALENPPAPLAGTAQLDLALNGQGLTREQLERTLAGQLNLQLDAVQVLPRALDALLPKSNSRLVQFDPTLTFAQFDRIDIAAVATNGIFVTERIQAQSTYVEITGSGQVAVPDRSLDVRLHATLTQEALESNRVDLAGLEIPLRVHGDWAQPTWAIDWAAVLREVARQALSERLRRRQQPQNDQ